MYTANFIRQFISSLPTNKLFTTRDVLVYGTRASVDQILYRLVKAGVLMRLARGVFAKQDSDNPHNFSYFDIAKVKARAFAKQVAAHGSDLAYELGLIPKLEDNNDKFTFCVNGSTSKFKADKTTIYFKRACARRTALSDSRAGKALRALWHIGRFDIDHATVMKAGKSFLRQDFEEVRRSAGLLPDWLNAQFHMPFKWIPVSI